MSEAFKKFYNQLNPGQKEAVDTLNGPLMVVAGPGTGKTQILTLRIANIIFQGKAKPEEILALTFTENAAFNMKRRLFQILGPAAYRTRIATFHSFCNDTILENPESFSFVKSVQGVCEGARSITEVEQVKIIEEILKIGNFERLNLNNPFVNYIAELKHAISNFKKEGLAIDDYLKIIEREEAKLSAQEDLYHDKGAHKGKMKVVYRDRLEQIEKNKEIYHVYQKYQEKLENLGWYDYDDMILFVLRAFRRCGVSDTPHLLEKLREQHKYILVDEHQDANSAQNEVVLHLGGEHKNIFVVGDEKQSIFRFQGASLENILYFRNKFSDCKIITLEKNYRSPQAIIDCAQSVIANNTVRLSAYVGNISENLISASLPPDGNRGEDFKSSAGGKIEVFESESPDDEFSFIVRKVKELQAGGAKFGEIAVLFRDNWEGYEIAHVLERAGIPYYIESNRNIFKDKKIQSFVRFLQFVSRGDFSARAFGRDEIDAEFSDILFSDFLEIPAIDVYKLADLRARERKRRSLFWIMSDKSIMEQGGIGSCQKIYDLARTISGCIAAAKQKNAQSAFESISKESRFLDYMVSLSSQDAILKFHTLFNELKSVSYGKRDYTLLDFCEHLALLAKYKISLNQKSLCIPSNALRLMTAHKAKGLEFDYVIISGCVDSRWGGRKRPDSLKLLEIAKNIGGNSENSEIEDARRLFYVAVTRAKKGVFATTALQNFEGREQIPSRFLSEIKPELVSRAAPALHTADPISEILLAPRILGEGEGSLLMKDSEYLRALFLNRGFAATHLNNYLDCPWKYFFRNLIRLPEAQAPYLLYGCAVHFALKKFFDNQGGSDPPWGGRTPEYLLREFVRVLERQSLSEYEFEKYRERGERALAAYFEFYNLGAAKSDARTINEFNVGSVMLDGEVRLTGKIDKIELSNGVVNVVDYKTGRRKTRGELTGTTKNSKGSEKRQLVFYKLLLDKLSDSPYLMTTGEIDFVEPEKRTRKFYKERFVITKDDVRELEYQIQDVVAEIFGLAFWDKRCADKKCRYCELREGIKMV